MPESEPGGVERVACLLCRRDASDLLFERQGYRIVRCRLCGLVYVNPRPAADARAALYEDPRYFGGGGWYLDYLGHEQNYRRLFRRLLAVLARHCPAPGRLLDVGSAAGFLLDEARRGGWDAEGVEPSPAMAAHAREALGLGVQRGTLEDAAFPDASFDAVCFCDSIEHLPDPLASLGEARRVLRPGGALMLMTPNVASLPARSMGRWWPHFTPREHLYYFAPDTLGRLLAEARLRQVESRSMGHYWSLGEIVGKLVPGGGRLGRVAGLRRLLGLPVYLNVGDLLVIARREG